jgi:predicted amidohydrolase
MTRGTLSIAIAQYAPLESSEGNFAAIAPIVAQAAGKGAEVVVFPEYSQAFMPGRYELWPSLAEPLDGPFVSGLQKISAECGGVVIVAGMLRESASPLPTNTIVAVGAKGVLVVADKLHLYDAFGASESSVVAPGELGEVELLEIGGHRLGFMACYDLRFPEVTRRLVDAGATALVIPAQWVPGDHKYEHWSTLLRARAIEAQCYVIAAGQPAPHGIGHSALVDPWGVVLGELGAESEVLHGSLELSVVEQVRSANPVAAARRFTVAPRP